MRRIILAVAVVLCVCLAVPPALDRASGQVQQAKANQPPFVHNVVVYAKKGTPPAKVDALIADCHNSLAKIPTVRGLWAGKPSGKGQSSDKAMLDYDVGLMVLFDNYDGLKTYLDHPLHLKFLEVHMPDVDKVLVYDFLNQAK
jgi:hypothetical protein